MGGIATRKRDTCPTCERGFKSCDGHFGHIKLICPVYHPGFITIIVKILHCVCYKCSGLLFKRNKQELERIRDNAPNCKEQFGKVYQHCRRTTICRQCDSNQPEYSRFGKVRIIVKNGDFVVDTVLPSLKVYQIFEKISEDDCRLLGFNPEYCRPHWLLISNLPVMPPKLRPFCVSYNLMSKKDELHMDDVSRVLGCIVKTNNCMKKRLEMLAKTGRNDKDSDTKESDSKNDDSNNDNNNNNNNISNNNSSNNDNDSKENKDVSFHKSVIRLLADLIQYYVTIMLDNPNLSQELEILANHSHFSHFGSRISKYQQSIKRKIFNRIGKNNLLSPSRNNDNNDRNKTQRARIQQAKSKLQKPILCMLGSDPLIALDTIGISLNMAMNVTYPQHVTPYNIVQMQQLITKGPKVYPGANFITIQRSMGFFKCIDLSTLTRDQRKRVAATIQLAQGYTVHRHLVDGDIVSVNVNSSYNQLGDNVNFGLDMIAFKVQVLKEWISQCELLWEGLIHCSLINKYKNGNICQLFIPQNEISRSEVKHLSMVSNNSIIRHRICLSDSLVLSCMKFVDKNQFFQRYEMSELLMSIDDDSDKGYDGKSNDNHDYNVNLRNFTDSDDENWDNKEYIDDSLMNTAITIPIPAIIAPKKLWTGRQIISLILPPIALKSQHVTIYKGHFVKGTLNKPSLYNIFNIISRDMGVKRAIRFLNQLTKLMSCFNMHHCDSVFIFDLKRSNGSSGNRSSSVNEWQKNKTRYLTNNPNLKDILTEIVSSSYLFGKPNDRIINLSLLTEYNGFGGGTRPLPHLPKLPGINIGFKRDVNRIESRRMKKMMKNYVNIYGNYWYGLNSFQFFFQAKKCRKQYVENEIGIIDDKNIYNTYNSNNQSGSQCLLLTNLNQFMSSLCVAYDASVRDANGNLIQFISNENGLDFGGAVNQATNMNMLGSYCDNNNYNSSEVKRDISFSQVIGSLTVEQFIYGHVFTCLVNNKKRKKRSSKSKNKKDKKKNDDNDNDNDIDVEISIHKRLGRCDITDEYISTEESMGNIDEKFLNELIEKLITTKREEAKELLDQEMKQLIQTWRWFKNNGKDCEAIQLPFNIYQLIRNGQDSKFIQIDNKNNVSLYKTRILNPMYVIKKLNYLYNEMSQALPFGNNFIDMCKRFIGLKLASKVVCRFHKLTKVGFDYVINEMKRKFIQSTMSAGEVTGLIAAQSIVNNSYLNKVNIQKLSQLLTFNKPQRRINNIGIGNKDIDGDNSNYVKCKVYFEDDCGAQMYQEDARKKWIEIEYRRLRDIVSKVEIYFDPNPKKTVISEDQEFVEDWWEFDFDEYSGIARNSIPFTVRLVLDRNKKEDILIMNSHIQEIIREKYWDRIICLFSNDNAETLVLHLKWPTCWLDYTNRILHEARKKQQKKENISEEDMNVFYNNDDFPRVGEFMDDWGNNGNGDDDRDDSMAYADIIQHLADFANNLMDEVELRGIKGVAKVIMSRDSNTNPEWYLDIKVTGYEDRLEDNALFMTEDEEKEFRVVNNPLLKLMNFDGVDHTRIQIDCIKDIYDIFGIEAARVMLLENMKQIFQNSIDIRHLLLVVEKITFDGTLRGLEQVNREKSDIVSPLMKCSMSNNSSCVPFLLQAATFGIEDNVNECTDKRIMFGKNYRGGTGSFDIFRIV